MYCYLYEQPIYLFFFPGGTSDSFLALLYYSHIPTALIALAVGLFVFFKARHLILNRLLLIISICFAFWVLASLVSWTNVRSDLILAIWPLFAITQALISIFSIYFILVFANPERKDITKKVKLILLMLLAPVFLFAHTNLSVSGFNITDCDAFGYEGIAYKLYYTGLEILALIWIPIVLVKAYRKASFLFKKQIILMGIGMESFLLLFFSAVFIVTTLVDYELFFSDSNYEWYGLFGMAFFMVMMGVLIVRFKTFNVGMLAAKALLISLIILVASQFTYATSITSLVLTSVTLILTLIIGIQLIRSVNKEVKHLKKLEILTQKLEVANEKLKGLDKLKSEFVSIASHQLRSPLTAIRGYASLLVEGSYGKLPAKASSALQRITDSAKNMALSIEDYLSVSRIESGNMKYNIADFNIKDEAEKISDDLRPQAIKEGLSLIFRTDLKSKAVVNADVGKTIQIIQNLVNNAIKYTEEGSIKIFVRDDIVHKKVYVDIIDTGIGMDEKALHSVFGKFERAENANKVNIHGTGLGLFVALKMAKAMGGDIEAHSTGHGQGSRFTLEMPLAM